MRLKDVCTSGFARFGARYELLSISGCLEIEASNGAQARVEFVGAFYHVICRGNQRQMTGRSNADRNNYLKRLEQYCQRGPYCYQC
jgi:hypothetical protein